MIREEIQILTANNLAKKVDLLSRKIYDKIGQYNNPKMAFVGIQSQGADFTNDLSVEYCVDKAHKTNVFFLDPTLYRENLDFKEIPKSNVVIPGKFDASDYEIIVLIDTVIKTGRTVKAAMSALKDYGRANQIQLATLVNVADAREVPYHPNPDLVGLEMNKNDLIIGGVEGKLDYRMRKGLYLLH